MDARITVAQNAGSSPNSELPKVVRLTKPQTDQAVAIHLDGATKLDLSAIGNDNVTFVHAGDRLVILFDNHSTVTIEPFYDSKGLPLGDITVELSPGRDVSGAEFASLFPITTDQSILPAAGDGGPAAGAHFETATVDPLGNSGAPLPLLGPDAPTGNGGPANPPGNVAVGPTVTGPTLGVHDVGGNEDKPIALAITDAPSISDPNASLRNLTITGVPVGATLSAGIHNADGSWTLTPAQLAGLTLASDGEVQHFTLTVTGAATDAAITATSTATLNVSVTPVAEAPTLALGNSGRIPFPPLPPIFAGEDSPVNRPALGAGPSASVFGVEDRPIGLLIKTALGEVDADAVLSVTISGIPTGVTLSAGTHNADGSVTLTPAQLVGLTLTGDSETTIFDLKVTATAVDGGDTATSASLSGTFHVNVTPVADTPTLIAPSTVSGNEGQPIALNISSVLPEVDRDAVLTLSISGIPDGVKLDDANHDRIVITNGSAVLTPGELAGLTLTGDGVTQHFDLMVTSSAADGTGLSSPVPVVTLHVDVAPAAVTEDVNVVAGNLTTAGSVSFADVGLSSTHSLVSVVPQGNNYLGTFAPTLGADGTVAWTFTVADDSTDFLAQGQTLTQTYALTVDDGHGGAVTQKVVVDIHGTNEAPLIVAAATTATGAVTEDNNADASNNLSTKGTVSFTDVDFTDTHSVSVVPQGSNYLGTFTPTFTTATDATGGKTGTVGWNFTVADDATDFLAQGQTLTQTYTVKVADGHGGVANQDVVVTINGSNESPTVNVNELATGALNEPTDTANQDNSVPGVQLTTTGTFSFADVDVKDIHSVTGVSSGSRGFGGSNLGTLTASVTQDTSNGLNGVVTWNYSVDTAAVESLALGETHTDTFRVFLADNHGGGVSKIVKVTTTGTNDVPVANDDSFTVTEHQAPIAIDSTFIANHVTNNDTLDPDHGAPNSVTFDDPIVAANNFGITANDVIFFGPGRGGDGDFELGAAFQKLTTGQTLDITVPYTLQGDQPTDTSTANLVIHVTGINDPPVTNDVVVQAANIAAGTPIQIKLTGSDVDGTVASFKVNDLPVGGTLFTDAAETHAVLAGDLIAASGNAATLFFKANAGANTTTFHFTAIDNEGLASTASATATINVNHPPVAVDQTFTVAEDGSLNISAALGVLNGDSDPDAGDTFKITAINGNDGSGIGTPFDLHFGNIVLQSDGSFTYQPQTAAGSPAQLLQKGNTGVDNFTYTITDNHGASSTATVHIDVLGDTDPPIAVTSNIVIASNVRTAVDWHLTVSGNPPQPLKFAVVDSFNHPDQWGPFLSFDAATGQFRVQTVPANGATPIVSGTGSTDFITYSITDGVPSDPVANGQLNFVRFDGSIPFNITGSANGDDFHFLGGAGGVDHLGNGNNFVEASGGLGAITTVFGGSGNNTFMGGAGAGQNIFHGGSGNDIITAGFHSDILDGGGGNNQFFVGTTSLVSGQVNHATITGGSGNNTFSLSNSDVASSSTITDYHFTPGGAQDTIDLTSLNGVNLGATFNNALFGTPGSPQPLFDPIANGLNLNDFIRLVDDANGKDVHLQVDPDGTGTGLQFHDVALLQNHRAADFTDLTIAGSDHIQFHGNNVEITDFGGGGNTTLYSGYSFLAGQTTHETMTGGGGNTTFSFNSTDPGTTATINNFIFVTGGQQDVLDFSHLNTINLPGLNQTLFGSSGFDPTANGKNVSDFVKLVNDANGKDVHVQVDADGTGAAHQFQDVVVLHNYQTHNNAVDIMFANHAQAMLHVA